MIAPVQLELPLKTVHLWPICLDEPKWQVEQLTAILSADERASAARFHFDRDRRRFVVGRGLLRTIMSQYLATEPAHLVFRYGSHGKPSLASPSSATGRRLCFNLSHSHGLALYAVAWDAALGVDVEQIRPLAEAQQLAERYFSWREKRMLEAIPENKQLQAFYTAWIRKEAYLKPLGHGISQRLDHFSVSLRSNSTNALLKVIWDPQAADRWWLSGLTPAPGFIGALCVEGHGWSLRSLEPGHMMLSFRENA